MSSAKETEEEEQQTAAFDKSTDKGAEGGLFQASMKSIRSAHLRANRLRAGVVVAGLFTDKNMYREVIALFYAVTKELETKLAKDSSDEICTKLLALGYNFTPEYEKDLQTLYTPETWQKEVESLVAQNKLASEYCAKIRSMQSDAELAGAAFCLWGALIIGGGAVAMPRVEALCGKEATHIFRSVTGPGRGGRKTAFVQTWDSLAAKDSQNFSIIVSSCQECMQGNNDLIGSVKRNPWWLNYVVSTAVGVTAIGVYMLQKGAKVRVDE